MPTSGPRPTALTPLVVLVVVLVAEAPRVSDPSPRDRGGARRHACVRSLAAPGPGSCPTGCARAGAHRAAPSRGQEPERPHSSNAHRNC